MRTLLVGLAVGALGVWAAAIVGVLYMIGALSGPIVGEWTETPSDSATMPKHDVAGSDLSDFPRFPGSVRVEFKETVEDSAQVTEAEYLADATIAEVRAHFEGAIEAGGWPVRWDGYRLGEWVYEVGWPPGTTVVIEIEAVERLVGVEIEVSQPVDEFRSDDAPASAEVPGRASPPARVVPEDGATFAPRQSGRDRPASGPREARAAGVAPDPHGPDGTASARAGTGLPAGDRCSGCAPGPLAERRAAELGEGSAVHEPSRRTRERVRGLESRGRRSPTWETSSSPRSRAPAAR